MTTDLPALDLPAATGPATVAAPHDSPLRAVLAKIDAEDYAPPAVRRASEKRRRLARVLDLARRFKSEYPGVKAALCQHENVGESCRIIHALAIIDYFADRLEVVCAPMVERPTQPKDSVGSEGAS